MSNKAVVLYGTNTFTRHLIPWGQKETDFWCWNEVASLKDDRPGYWAKQVDLVFQMHVPAIWRNPQNVNHAGHYAWLQRKHDIPIYMQDRYDDVPSSVKYPKEEIIRMLLPNIWRDINGKVAQVKNFTSSTAYAIALATYFGYERIELAGIEMTSDTEYVRQRPGVLFWIGIAVGRGIDVVLHSPLLMNDKDYGYTGEVMITKQQFEMASRKLQEMTEEKKSEAFIAKGRSQAMLDALIMNKDPNQGQRLLNSYLSTLNKAQDAAFEFGQLAGAMMENERYSKQCDEMIMAAGGEKALQRMMGLLDEAISPAVENEVTIQTTESIEA